MTYSLVVVGCGGTGTYFLKEFSRFIRKNRTIGQFILIDGDRVEEKNLERQSFQREDIGLNKAVVMADVLYSAFDIHWESMNTYLTKPKQLVDLISYTPIIIGCVDNHACRLVLEEYFKKVPTCAYFDSGNEYQTGEVVFAYKANGKVISPLRSVWFPDMLKGDLRSVTEVGCEELNAVSPQHIVTNMLAGNILLAETASFLGGKPHPGVVFFDAMGYSTEYVSYKERKQ